MAWTERSGVRVQRFLVLGFSPRCVGVGSWLENDNARSPTKNSELRNPLLFLPQLFFDELEDEVYEFVHAGGEFFFDGGEVFGFGFAVVFAVRSAGLAPAAGV